MTKARNSKKTVTIVGQGLPPASPGRRRAPVLERPHETELTVEEILRQVRPTPVMMNGMSDAQKIKKIAGLQ